MTLKVIGEKHGLSTEQIRQIIMQENYRAERRNQFDGATDIDAQNAEHT